MGNIRSSRFKLSPLRSFSFRYSINFLEGLHGFEKLHHYLLIGSKNETPFLWLQSKEQKSVLFALIDPFVLYPDYSLKISETSLRKIQAKEGDSLAILAIVNIESEGCVNLGAPLLIHWKKKLAIQILLPAYFNI